MPAAAAVKKVCHTAKICERRSPHTYIIIGVPDGIAARRDVIRAKGRSCRGQILPPMLARSDFFPTFASQFAGQCPRLLWRGPFVYRLGRKIFILERGVRFSYGLPERDNHATRRLCEGGFFANLYKKMPICFAGCD